MEIPTNMAVMEVSIPHCAMFNFSTRQSRDSVRILSPFSIVFDPDSGVLVVHTVDILVAARGVS
ncbi:hypothetical protein GQ600_10098 [Phytophthora cactorum]|nr:hypothetical protein GQ600_10098 [Phytophthora cactorum]